MLKARKKLSQKELKQDKLVTTYFQSKDWFSVPENRRKVSIAVGIVIVLIVAGFFYTSSRKSKSDEAETKLSAVINLYDAGKYQDAINGDPAAGITGLKDIVNNYGSTESGETAKLFLGNCYFNISDYDNAQKQFDDYSGKNDIIKSSCISGVGAVYEAKGDVKKAAEYYEKAAKISKDVITNQENLFYAVRAFTKAGDKDNAKRVYSLLKDQYPKSKYINETKRFETEFKD